MKHTASALFVAGCLGAMAPAHADTVPGYTYERAAGSFDTIASATIAFRFTANEAISVTALGVVDTGAPGLNAAHSVGLWTDSGTLLAVATVAAGTSSPLQAGFRFAAIEPLSLVAGQSYRVGAVFDIDNFSDTWVQAPALASSAEVTLLDLGWTYGASGTTLAFPDQRSMPGSAAANFLFAPVPEVPPAVTLGVGLAVLGLARRRR